MASKELTDRFIKGLREYKISYDDIYKNGWRYCGGNHKQHLNYFKLLFKDEQLPPIAKSCVCGHSISENCYITDGKQKLVLGNCCIKKFIPNSGRTCSVCGDPHKNRVINKCNTCRSGVCDKCGSACDTNYRNCYDCDELKYGHRMWRQP